MKNILNRSVTRDPFILRRAFFLIAILACSSCLGFGTHALLTGHIGFGLTDYAILLSTITMAIIAYKRPASIIPYYGQVILVAAFFFFNFISGGDTGHGHLWIILVPLCGPFFLGWRHGGAISAGCFILAAAVVAVDSVCNCFPALPAGGTLIRLATIYLISLFVSCFYDYWMQMIRLRLVESENRINSLYVDLVETSQDLIWQSDAQGLFTYLNPAWKDVLGYDLAEMLGKPFMDFQMPEQAARDRQEISLLMQGDTVKGFETIYLHKNGTKVYLVFNAKLIRSADGEITGIRGTAYDISARKQTEVALRESTARLTSIIDSTPFGAHQYRLDANDRLVFTGYNRSAERILGVEHEQFIGKTIQEAFPPMAGTEIPQRYAAVATTGVAFKTEQVDYDHDGIKGVFELHAVQIAPGNMAAFFHDVTEKRKDEAALREQERKFRAIFNSTFQFVGLLTPEGILTEINEPALAFCGISHNDAINRPFWETPWWSGNEERLQKLKDAIARCAKGEFIRYEVEQQGAGGAVAIVDFSLKPVWGADGTISMLVPEGRDVTELKRTESLLLNAQKLESLGVLAGGIAHDFNNLLTGIFGNIELAEEGVTDKETARFLATASGAIERARDLTHQLLTFSKGGVPVKRTERLGPFIRKAVKFVFSGSNVSCTVQIPDDAWPCSIDRNQIEQVIDNLLINAQQAMPQGGTVELTAGNVIFGERQHPVLPAGSYVRIVVRDNGIGMPQSILNKIFDPFFTTKTKGHGLGLATSYSIIKRHDGCIDVESEPGKGSSFTVYLPAIPGAVPAEVQSAGISYKGSGTVLIMDDEDIILKTITAMLRTLGHSTICTSNGKEAIDRLQSDRQGAKKIVAAILDLTIPGQMGGKETIREIRLITTDLPVFVASGYTGDEILADPQRYGFNASLGKPFSLLELAAMFERHLGIMKG